MASCESLSRSREVERILMTEKQKFWVLLVLLLLSVVLLLYLNTTNEKLFIG
jgi:4-hydroxybenzoate polyprenyltransferase